MYYQSDRNQYFFKVDSLKMKLPTVQRIVWNYNCQPYLS